MRISHFRIAVLGALWAFSSSSSAQVNVWQVDGPAAGDALGWAMCSIDDQDGDSVRDIVVGAPRSDFSGPNSGSVYVLSGATGAVLRRVDGVNNGELLGQALAPVNDVNGDGISDWIAGAPFASVGTSKNGRAEVRSGADGTLLIEVVGVEAFGLAGTAVAGTGDGNGDGVPDIVVGAPNEDANGTDSGSVTVYSGATGGYIRGHTGMNPGDQLGTSLLGISDITGDGIDDYAAGTPYGSNGLGYLQVHSGATGANLYTLIGPELDAGFARVICALGDANSDGLADIAIGSPDSSLGGIDAGMVSVISASTGGTIRLITGQPGEHLGRSVADAGDWDGDGVSDLLVGGLVAGTTGMVRVYSGADGSLLASTSGQTGDQEAGSALAGDFDIDGDGRSEFVLGDKLADSGGQDSGLARSYSSHNLLGVPYCFGSSLATCPCGNTGGPTTGCRNSSLAGGLLDIAGSASVSADDLALLALQLLPGKAALALVGSESVNGGNGSPFGDGLRCAGGVVQGLGVRIPGASGSATWGPGLSGQVNWDSGDARFFQVLYRDSQVGGPCGLGFNLTNGVQVSFLP
ncbi:MAG: hypothetical protein ACI8X5_000758 [Planctomycetota bacterium]|jgi:hypothetical protein